MFDKELLENFRKVYNSEHEDKIKDSDDVWSELKRKMHSKCKTGRVECIVAHLMNKPKAPQSWMVNPTEWNYECVGGFLLDSNNKWNKV